MATMVLPPEFRRLLNSLNSNSVEDLLVGGSAVIFHRYVRTTGNMDSRIAWNSALGCLLAEKVLIFPAVDPSTDPLAVWP